MQDKAHVQPIERLGPAGWQRMPAGEVAPPRDIVAAAG